MCQKLGHAADTELPSCPPVGEQSCSPMHAMKDKNGTGIIGYFTVTQSKMLDYFRDLREPQSRWKGSFSYGEWGKDIKGSFTVAC